MASNRHVVQDHNAAFRLREGVLAVHMNGHADEERILPSVARRIEWEEGQAWRARKRELVLAVPTRVRKMSESRMWREFRAELAAVTAQEEDTIAARTAVEIFEYAHTN